jgi:hypothetical protein
MKRQVGRYVVRVLDATDFVRNAKAIDDKCTAIGAIVGSVSGSERIIAARS